MDFRRKFSIHLDEFSILWDYHRPLDRRNHIPGISAIGIEKLFWGRYAIVISASLFAAVHMDVFAFFKYLSWEYSWVICMRRHKPSLPP